MVWDATYQPGPSKLEEAMAVERDGPVTYRAERLQVGACNFCSQDRNHYHYVWVVRPARGGLEVRFCDRCMVSVRKSTGR